MSRKGSIWKSDFFFLIFLYLKKDSYISITCGMIFSKSEFFFLNIISPCIRLSDLSQDIFEIESLNTAKVSWGPWRA